MTPAPGERWGERRAAAETRLAATGVDDAESKLRWLAAHVIGCGLMDADLRREETVSAEAGRRFEDGVNRLAAHEPVQYVIGETEFMGLRFRCDRRALIPRPETELLVEAAEAALRILPGRPAVLDVGTGTGCVACALALRVPLARVAAVDCSPDALALARENAAALGAPVEFRLGDLLEGVPANSLDLVVSNPPYVSTGECGRLPPTVRDFEPRSALDGGADGLETISRLVSAAAGAIVPGGRLMMEIGDDQASAVQEILCQTPPLQLESLKSDFAGRARLVLARRTA